MSNQRGQIHIILLVLFVVGFILYINFSGIGINKLFESFKIGPKSQVPSTVRPAVPSSPGQIVPAPVLISPVAGIDTAPPQRLNIQPKGGNFPPETRQVAVNLETDEKATCKYSDVANVSFGSMQGKFSQTNSTSHSVLITTLSEGGQYAYFIKCADEKGNENTDDVAVSFGIMSPADTAPPVLSNPSHQGDVLPAGTASAVISISTNEPASCRYSAVGGLSYSSMPSAFSQYDQTKRFHVKQISGLVGGINYEFFVRCQDLSGNTNTGDVLISFSVK